jgi:hypothetical protein
MSELSMSMFLNKADLNAARAIEAADKSVKMFDLWNTFDFEARCANVQEFLDSFAEIQDLLSANQYNNVMAFRDEAREYYLPKVWA